MRYIIAADIGGSHISSALVDSANWSIVGLHQTNPVNAFEAAATIVNGWGGNLQSTAAYLPKMEKISLAIAMPGPFDYGKGLFMTHPGGKLSSLAGHQFEYLLRPFFPSPPTFFFENDAACFGLGEAHFGVGIGAGRVIGITLGTGIGSSFIVDGRIVKSGKGVPSGGEIYKRPFAEGLADDYFTTRWFLRTAREQLKIEATGLHELLEKAPSDEMSHIFNLFGENLASFLLPFAKAFAADIIIFGGNIAKAWHFFSTYLNTPFTKSGIAVTPGCLGERAVFLGAAKMFHQKQSRL